MHLPTGQTGLLARHFFWRFFDNDLVSPDADAHQSASLAVAFVAIPPLFVSAFLFLRYGNPWMEPTRRLMLSLGDKLQFISWSMMVMGLATIVVWDALALDARDFAVLGPLPIRRRTLLAGKLAAVSAFVAVFALAANISSMALFPLAYLSSSRMPLVVGLWVFAGHTVACLGAAVFAFFAVLAVRGLALNVLGPARFKRYSIVIQFALALFIFTDFLSVSVGTLARGGIRPFFSPPLWFLGLYETIVDRGIAGTLSPAVQQMYGMTDVAARDDYQSYAAYWSLLQALGTRALVGFAAGGVLAAAAYFASHFRHESHLRQLAVSGPAHASALRRFGRLLARRVLVRDPIAQAGFFFTLQTLARSARHKAYLAGYLLAGCVLTYTTIVSVAATRGARLQDDAGLFWVQIVLSSLLLVGLRAVFGIPADLRANWVFRLTTGTNVKRYLAGVRRAIGAVIVVPFFVALLPPHAVVCGAWTAAMHAAVGILTSLLLFETLMLHFEKVPFTCARASNGSLKMFWPAYLIGFLVYTSTLAKLEAVALARPSGWKILLALLLVALAAIAIYRNHLLAMRTGFVFDEAPDTAVVPLGL